MQPMKDILKELRKSKKYSQEDMAAIVGLSKSAISMYERGERMPDNETLAKYASHFGVDYNFLHGYISDNCNEATRFCDRLKKALALRNMKASALAKKINVNRSYVSNWLAGKYNAKTDKQIEIAKILSVSPAWLAGHNVPMQEEKSSLKCQLTEEMIIYYRDGRTIIKRFSPEQIRAIHAFLEAMPGEPKEEEDKT